MDLGTAERGGGTQPLFSLMSVCLLVCVCLHVCAFPLSACLTVCLEMFEHSPICLPFLSPFFPFLQLNPTDSPPICPALSLPLLSPVFIPRAYFYSSSVFLYILLLTSTPSHISFIPTHFDLQTTFIHSYSLHQQILQSSILL